MTAKKIVAMLYIKNIQKKSRKNPAVFEKKSSKSFKRIVKTLGENLILRKVHLAANVKCKMSSMLIEKNAQVHVINSS